MTTPSTQSVATSGREQLSAPPPPKKRGDDDDDDG